MSKKVMTKNGDVKWLPCFGAATLLEKSPASFVFLAPRLRGGLRERKANALTAPVSVICLVRLNGSPIA